MSPDLDVIEFRPEGFPAPLRYDGGAGDLAWARATSGFAEEAQAMALEIEVLGLEMRRHRATHVPAAKVVRAACGALRYQIAELRVAAEGGENLPEGGIS